MASSGISRPRSRLAGLADHGGGDGPGDHAKLALVGVDPALGQVGSVTQVASASAATRNIEPLTSWVSERIAPRPMPGKM